MTQFTVSDYIETASDLDSSTASLRLGFGLGLGLEPPSLILTESDCIDGDWDSHHRLSRCSKSCYPPCRRLSTFIVALSHHNRLQLPIFYILSLLLNMQNSKYYLKYYLSSNCGNIIRNHSYFANSDTQ